MSKVEGLLERPVAPDAFERLTKRRRRRALRRRLTTGLLAISVAATGSVIAFRAFRPPVDPVDQPTTLRLGAVTRFRLEHPPQPIAAGLGAGWAMSRQTKGDEIHSLYRLDPLTGQVHEIDLAPDNPEDVAVGEGSVWVAGCREVADDSECAEGKAFLLRLDPANGAVLRRTPIPGCCHGLFTGSGAVWVDSLIRPSRRVGIRVDPETADLSVPDCCPGRGEYLDSYGAGWLWGGSLSNGPLLQVDPATLQIHRTVDDLCLISPWNVVVLAARCDREQKTLGHLDAVSGHFVPSPVRSSDYPYDRFAEQVVATGETGWFLERREDIIVRSFTRDGTAGGPWLVPAGPGHISDFGIGPEPFFVTADEEAEALWISDFISGEVLRVAIVAAP